MSYKQPLRKKLDPDFVLDTKDMLRDTPSFTCFTCFPKLPLELQRMIWKAALPESRRLVTFPEPSYSGRIMVHRRDHGFSCCYSMAFARPPAISRVCFESRAIALQQGQYYRGYSPHQPGAWLNPDCDLIFIHPRQDKNEKHMPLAVGPSKSQAETLEDLVETKQNMEILINYHQVNWQQYFPLVNSVQRPPKLVVGHYPMHLTKSEIKECRLFGSDDFAIVNVEDMERMQKFAKWFRLLGTWRIGNHHNAVGSRGAIEKLAAWTTHTMAARKVAKTIKRINKKWVTGYKAYRLGPDLVAQLGRQGSKMVAMQAKPGFEVVMVFYLCSHHHVPMVPHDEHYKIEPDWSASPLGVGDLNDPVKRKSLGLRRELRSLGIL